MIKKLIFNVMIIYKIKKNNFKKIKYGFLIPNIKMILVKSIRN